MFSKEKSYFMSREAVYDMLTKENDYASGWGEGKTSAVETFPDHVVSRTTGVPFSEMEWVNFAEKYIAEFKAAHANYCPDNRALRIRLLKAASLLVTALQVHGNYNDFEEIAGVSSSKFPILHGGLKTFVDNGKKQST